MYGKLLVYEKYVIIIIQGKLLLNYEIAKKKNSQFIYY